MKQFCFAVLLLLLVTAGHAQVSANGTISAQGSTCATTQACVFLTLYNSVNGSTGGVAIAIPANASGNTLQFEGTADGVNWVAVNATPFNSTTAVTSTTGTGTWQLNAAGLVGIRVRCSTFVSGTATVTINASTASARSGSGAPGGVTSFNSRTGAITPQPSDYPFVQRCPFRAGYIAGPVLINAQLRSQTFLCEIPSTASIKQIVVGVDSGASTIRFCDLNAGVCTALSATITPALVSGLHIACMNVAGTAITFGGVSVTCGTLTLTTLAAGDIIQTTADGTADGTSVVLFGQIDYTFSAF